MRRRLMRWGKWGGLALTAGLVILYAASARWAMVYWRPAFALGIGRGAVGLARFDPPRPARAVWELYPHREPMNWRGGWEQQPGTLWVSVPLWIPCLLAGAATVPLWRLDRRRAPGSCKRCGYDLRGLTHTCPECGTPQEARA